MPELPEVETMRRGVMPIVGRRIVNVVAGPCGKRPMTISPKLAAWTKRLGGQRVVAVERLGKRVVFRLDSTDAIVIEPRMTGLVLLADPPSTDHLRFVVRLAGRPPNRLLYWDRRGLGVARVLRPAEFQRHYGPARIGPDALLVSADDLREHLGDSRRAIKTALLDQRAVAGIGNLYAAEILFEANIHPRRRCQALTRSQWQRLHAATQRILHEAILCEGSTLGDGTYRNALNQTGSYQNHHRVYDRQGEACPCCGQAIVRIVQAQRSTFYCRTCQRNG